MNESKEAFKRIRKKDWALVLVAIGLGVIFSLVFLITINPIFLIVGFGTMLLGVLHLAWASKPKE